MAIVYCIIPVFNEMESALGELLEILDQQAYRYIIVDDGSNPPHHIPGALPEGCYWLRHTQNMGQGAALQTGMDQAIQLNADFVVHLDADGQHRVSDIPVLLNPLFAGQCDMVLGSRFLDPAHSQAVPWKKRLLLRVARYFHGIVLGVWLSDAHNGFRALNRKSLQTIRLIEKGRAHASEIVLLAQKSGLRIQEVPVLIQYPDLLHKKGIGPIQLIQLTWRVILLRISKRVLKS